MPLGQTAKKKRSKPMTGRRSAASTSTAKARLRTKTGRVGIIRVGRKDSVKRRFAEAGLVADVNADLVKSHTSRRMPNDLVERKLVEDGPVMEWSGGDGPAKRARPLLTQAEREYIEPLVAKHGADVVKMRRDTRLNWKQLEEDSLSRLVERLQRLSSSGESGAGTMEDDE